RLLLALLCCGAAPAAAAPPPWEGAWSDPNSWSWGWDDSQSQSQSQIPVAVQCQEAQLVVTVHRDLFGNGRLVSAAELSLGPAACKHSRLDPSRNTVTFSAGLHECGSTVQITPDSLIYRTLLTYEPSPGSNPAIVRSSPAVVPIECHYPSVPILVSPFPVSPSQYPQSIPVTPFPSQYPQSIPMTPFPMSPFPFPVSPTQCPHSCPSFPSPHPSVPIAVSPISSQCPHSIPVSPFHSCLVDGRSDATGSAFVTPRPRQDVLRFQIDAFRFAGDPRNLIYITCHLKVTPAEQSPDALNKACSFNKALNTWAPVEGTRDICSCCELGNCGSAALARSVRPAENWSGHR
ncbi:ZP3 protein, partial [Corvus moneduloides]|nr:ZP3 protein [Corvus moneduloides]